ncbi:MAG: response regulator [Candidatus Heimdallarchaeaceae archaeon]
MQELYKLYLSEMKHKVIGTASDGNEALVDLYFNFAFKPPDILILDFDLPGRNGLELLRDLKNLNFLDRTKVLLVSGLGNLQHKAESAGVAKFLSKPLKFKSLNKTIVDLIT